MAGLSSVRNHAGLDPILRGRHGKDGRDGLNGTAPFQVLDDLSPNPNTETDFGQYINSFAAAGGKRLVFRRDADYPFTTPLNLAGRQFDGIVFEGPAGSGWYQGDPNDRTGCRLVYKGGASPTVSGTDGAMTSGSTTLNSASGPFTRVGNYHNGQPITVHGAGPGGADLVTQIHHRVSNTQVVLCAAASTTVSAASWTFTNYTVAIDMGSSTGIEWRDIKLIQDDPTFDGHLIFWGFGPASWAARGKLTNVEVYGDLVGGVRARNAYSLLTLNGHGEMFQADTVQFGYGKAHVRGQYNVNADDATFKDCNFDACSEGSIINPGRNWLFPNSRWSHSQGNTFRYGPGISTDRVYGANIEAMVTLEKPEFWDFGTLTISDAAITTGQTTLTSASAPFVGSDGDWIDRNVAISGAGAAGGILYARIVQVLSTTQVVLSDAAGTTVSAATAQIMDAPLILTRHGADPVEIHMVDHFIWNAGNTCPEFTLLGPGKIVFEHQTSSYRRQLRRDVRTTGPMFEFGNPATDLVTVYLKDLGAIGAAGLANDDDYLIKNNTLAGHDLREIDQVPNCLNYKRQPLLRHTSVASSSGQGEPVCAPSAGQPGTITGACKGSDEDGIISVTVPASTTAVAGNVLDVAFKKPWKTLTNSGTGDNGMLRIILTPLDKSSSIGAGDVAFDAGAIGVSGSGQGDLTGWTLRIRHPIAAAGTAVTARWAYEIKRL